MLEAESDVSFAYMFGSFAKGHARSGSDMDIAVFLRDNSGIEGRLSRALALEGELERVVHRRVQIVVLNDAPLDLRRNVLGHGTLLCDRAPAARRAFFVETGRQYYDRAMAAAIFDRYRARRLRDGTFGG
jgi:predicted nucleotidyltransferase